MISTNTRNKVLDAADIVEVISGFVDLRKAGANYQACCPFHQERTPSFVVFPRNENYKCFGCGKQGNAISFLMEHEGMDYPEAVKWLAKKYHVEIEEEEETVEQQQKRLHQEALQVAIDKVNEFYGKEFYADNDGAAKARTYAYSRWGEEFCRRKGIGYAPSEGRRLMTLGLKEELLHELELVSKAGFDFFQNRITIPIFTRSRRLIGFTARVMDDSKPKYLNSKNSTLYDKSTSVFGIEDAWRQGSKERTFYLVEGGPDCLRMQMIGIDNTVACLGSHWTEQHFRQLKKAASHLCFLPDDDPPKENEPFGHGIDNVFSAGKLAMEMGFSVGVKEIPDDGHEQKQDPDSYFISKEIFDDTEEQDFIIWYAKKKFPVCKTTEQQSLVFKEVAHLLSLLDDKMRMTMYITELVKVNGIRKIWQQAVDDETERNEKDRRDKDGSIDDQTERQYGFYFKDNKYYSVDKGSAREWSNFIMKPLFHIISADDSVRLFRVVNEWGQETLVELVPEDLVSLKKFKEKLEAKGNFLWNGDDKNLHQLKRFLFKQTDTAMKITQLGWHRKGFYAFGNGIVDNSGKWHGVDDYGIVRMSELGNYYLPAFSFINREDVTAYQFEKRFAHLGYSAVGIREFTDQLFKVYGDNGRMGFCFYLATLFRDVVVAAHDESWFPILNLFGPKGTGKSELAHCLESFFLVALKAPNISNSTIPALNDSVAAAANAIVHLEEYKNTIDVKVMEFLKGLWDSTGRTRMNMDKGKRKETTAVDAGIVLSGQEMPTADIALFSRLIHLTFPRSVFSTDEKREFRKLVKMRSKGLVHITVWLLQLRQYFEQNFQTALDQVSADVCKRLEGKNVEDRIQNNWMVPLAAFKCLRTKIDVCLTYGQMLDFTIQGIIHQNSECKTSSELGGFWNVVQYLVSEGDLKEGADFRIEYVSKFSSNLVKERQWQTEQPVLYLQKSRIFMLYKKHGRMVGDAVLPEESLKYYLKHSNAYMGEKVVKYYVYNKGGQVYDTKQLANGGQPVKAKTTQRSFCFDYLKLREAFGINLEWSKNNDEAEVDID